MATDDDDGAGECSDCPLCCNALDATDRHFRPCRCGYQICAWCWHQLMELAAKDDGKGKCPACRTPYDESTIRFEPPDPEELERSAAKKKKTKSRISSGGGPGGGGDDDGGGGASRRHLANVRVVQRNLVYVVGLTEKYCVESALRGNDLFGRFGRITKCQTAPPRHVDYVARNRYGANTPASELTGGAYITYASDDAARRCVAAVDGTRLDGKSLRACHGTTKYCNAFIRHEQCRNPECAYLHTIGDDADSFTKEEMLARYGSKQGGGGGGGGGGGAKTIPAPPGSKLTGGLPTPRLPVPFGGMPPPPPPPPPGAAGAWGGISGGGGGNGGPAAAPRSGPPLPPLPVGTTANGLLNLAEGFSALGTNGSAATNGSATTRTRIDLGTLFGGDVNLNPTAAAAASAGGGEKKKTSTRDRKNGVGIFAGGKGPPLPRVPSVSTLERDAASKAKETHHTVGEDEDGGKENASASTPRAPAGSDDASAAFPDSLFDDTNANVFDPWAAMKKADGGGGGDGGGATSAAGGGATGTMTTTSRSRFGFVLDDEENNTGKVSPAVVSAVSAVAPVSAVPAAKTTNTTIPLPKPRPTATNGGGSDGGGVGGGGARSKRRGRGRA